MTGVKRGQNWAVGFGKSHNADTVDGSWRVYCMMDMAVGIANCMSNHQKSVENEDN